MIELDWSRCRLEPYAHQRIGVRELAMPTNPKIGRVIPNVLALGDQVGAGKSKQEIDAAQFVYLSGEIDTMVVVTPGFARSVWSDPDPILGEVAKHAFRSVDNVVSEYSAGRKANETISFRKSGLHWIVTNYEFIRRPARLAYLMKALRDRRVWLVLDESWSIKTYDTDNAKASVRLRTIAKRATILNGSLHEDPLDLFSQMNFLDKRILANTINGEVTPMSWTGFKATYAIMGGYKVRTERMARAGISAQPTQVIGYQNLDHLMSKVKPYILQRKTRECIDLPTFFRRSGSKRSSRKKRRGRSIKEMRDQMIAWLDDSTHVIVRQAVVKMLRLAQITSGFIGGVEGSTVDPFAEDHHPATCEIDGCETCEAYYRDLKRQIEGGVREVGREKLDTLIDWLHTAGPKPDRLLVWCKFRPELTRAAAALASEYQVFKLEGGQTRDEREAAKRALAPDTVIDGPVAIVGNTGAGGAGLNLAGANIAVYLSLDFSLLKLNQSKGRIDRPGQKRPITYVYVTATGPKGQKTIDHHILKALLNQGKISDWTAQQWKSKLLEE
jgi:SNF2 family DNA or RNA helicase